MVKSIKNYSKYFIHKDGFVISKERKVRSHNSKTSYRKIDEKVLKKSISTTGYYCVRLYDDLKKHKLFYLHRLIAEYFIENPENKPFVNHKDGNKLNNSIENLEWCTQKENVDHAIKTGLSFPPKPRIGKQNHKSKEVLKICKTTGKVIDKYESARQAEFFNKTTNISRVCRGLSKSAGGYIWRYA